MPEDKGNCCDQRRWGHHLRRLRLSDSLMRCRLVNVACCIQSFADVVILAIFIGIMFGLRVKESEAKDNWETQRPYRLRFCYRVRPFSARFPARETSSMAKSLEPIHLRRRVVASSAREQSHLEFQGGLLYT